MANLRRRKKSYKWQILISDLTEGYDVNHLRPFALLQILKRTLILWANQRTISDTHLSWSQKWEPTAKSPGLDTTSRTFPIFFGRTFLNWLFFKSTRFEINPNKRTPNNHPVLIFILVINRQIGNSIIV